MCHGANVAFLELARAGFVDTGSVMVPCPWFPEIAAAAAGDPALDLGVHLTLTSEWAGYRWRPISTMSRASGPDRRRRLLPARLPGAARESGPEAAEIEMRAQIDRALKAGIDATHLDTHMGAALVPELLDVTIRLAREYRLSLLLPRDVPLLCRRAAPRRDRSGSFMPEPWTLLRPGPAHHRPFPHDARRSERRSGSAYRAASDRDPFWDHLRFAALQRPGRHRSHRATPCPLAYRRVRVVR